MLKLTEKLPNLRLVRQRYSTIWGGASLLTMLLSAIKELLEMEDWTDWDFVLNLSESDYPVKVRAEKVSNKSNIAVISDPGGAGGVPLQQPGEQLREGSRQGAGEVYQEAGTGQDILRVRDSHVETGAQDSSLRGQH